MRKRSTIVSSIIVALGLALPISALAEGPFMGFGLGVFNSAKYSPAEVKTFQVGYRQNILYGLADWQHKIAYWGEGSGDPDRSGSFMVSSGPGWTVRFNPVEIRVGAGLAVISAPDSYLGGRFPQINSEIYLGVRDSVGRAIGIKYEHVSSAGIVLPNKGRDFMVVEISLGW